MTDTPQTRTTHAVARAHARTSGTPTEASDGCYICQQKLWISVFFDEPTHDAKNEYGTEKLSNIGKLFYSHEALNADRGIYPLYYNGLGVKFREPNVARMKTAREIGADQVKDVAKDKMKEVFDKARKGEGENALKDLKNPKSWLGDIAGILGKIGIENVGAVRDREAVSKVTLSGVPTRVNNALEKIAQVVNSQTQKVTHIDIAVFGSGLGGAIARLFINKLIEECKKDGDVLTYPTPWGLATLSFRFLGLLDCMSATLDDNSVIKWIASKLSLGFATLRIEGPMGIPEDVQQVSHYVAGHELRVSRRLDSVRKGKAQSTKEIALPGNHEDLAGNYLDGFESRSAQISRIAVLRLHGDAYTAGLPIMSMEKLKKKSIFLYGEFQVTATTQVHAGMPALELDHLLLKYIRTSGRLEDQLTEHMRHFISWMSRRHDTPGHPGRPPETAYDLVKEQINRLRAMVNHPDSTYTLSRTESTLLETWANPLPLDDYEMAIFDHYIHDELYLSPFDQAAADWLHNGYFKLRGIDESDELNKDEENQKKQELTPQL